jgi:hypothetical protein
MKILYLVVHHNCQTWSPLRRKRCLGVSLDAEIAVTFNQPMEAESVAANLALVDSNGGRPPELCLEQDFRRREVQT